MRRFLALLALLLLMPQLAYAALVKVQHKTNTATSGSTVAVTVTALTGGNLVIVGIGGSLSESVSTVGDGGNTYVQVTSAKATEAGGRWTDIYYAVNITGGSTTVTVTYSATSAARKAAEVWEVSGAATSNPLDGNGVGTTGVGAGGIYTGPSITTTQANTFIAAVARVAGNISGESDATFAFDDAQGGGGGASSVIVSATGTYTPVWAETLDGNFAASIAAFQIATGGCTPTMALLGVGRCG